ncbi:thermonuclease family protein [Lysinibacillus xylanilyticus]|uniref:thermonuclease family protein n=1 Tax=Lysinibacillus xylanilyticus TaxID=582475 RepID=UPI0037FCF8C2
MTYRKLICFGSIVLSAAIFLISCSAEGESYRKSNSEEKETSEEKTATDKIVESVISVAVDGIISTYFPNAHIDNAENVKGLVNELLNYSPEINDLIDPFFSSIQPLNNEIGTEYYNVSYSFSSDGDTQNFKVISAFKISSNEEGNKPIEKLKAGELSVGDEITIRSLLIDTPEMNLHKGKKPEPYAEAALKFADSELKKASSIVIAYDKGKHQDHFSRQLMYIWCDGELLSKKLLEQGLAKISFVTEPNTTYLKELQLAEDRAIKKKLGIWSRN